MIARNIEIKVALLGNVSAGKTTVLNALFRDKYGEVSMQRTTAGINYFRVNTPENVAGLVDDDGSAKSAESLDSMKSSDVDNEAAMTRSAKSTLKEIAQDNVKLREGDKIQEKYFDIQLKKELVSMRKYTKLVVVDIPGINEANVVNKYKDYISEKWDTFDCVVVVMDGKQGVNTEDQVYLLNLVKENLQKKDVPVIILCNKVDDPDDEEQEELIKEARKEVEKIFDVGCRKESLETLLDKNGGQPLHQKMSPAFIPISAIHAYIHQSASLMSREQFDSFDKDLLEKLGREQIGRRRWTRLSEEQKLDEAYKVITEGYQDGIQDSNFDKLLAALRHFLGGDEKQRGLIEKQIEVELGALLQVPSQAGRITSSLRSIYEKSKLLTGSTGDVHLPTAFWTAYTKYEDTSFQTFESKWPNGFHELAGPMEELIAYDKLVCLPGWDDDEKKVVAKMKAFIRRLVSFLIELHAKARDTNGWEKQGHSMASAQPDLHLLPHDWFSIWGSFLLLSSERRFCEEFGREKITFERLSQDSNYWRQIACCKQDHLCLHCLAILGETFDNTGSYKNCCHVCRIAYGDDSTDTTICPKCGVNLPEDKQCSGCEVKYSHQHIVRGSARFDPTYNEAGCLLPVTQLVRVRVPDSMSDTSHVAHVLWKFCRFMDSVEKREWQQQPPYHVHSQVGADGASNDSDSQSDKWKQSKSQEQSPKTSTEERKGSGEEWALEDEY